MSGAYLPVTREVRDRVNDYLAGMAARGFGVTEDMLRRVCQTREEDRNKA